MSATNLSTKKKKGEEPKWPGRVGQLKWGYRGLKSFPLPMVPDVKVLTDLDLSGNSITDISFVNYLPNLTNLILDGNKIAHTAVVPNMPKLDLLYLNNNLIGNSSTFVPKVAKACTSLRYFSMLNNEGVPNYFTGASLDEYNHYRLFVLSSIPTLLGIDSSTITDEEREACEEVFGKSFKKRRKTVRQTSSPSSSFNASMASSPGAPPPPGPLAAPPPPGQGAPPGPPPKPKPKARAYTDKELKGTQPPPPPPPAGSFSAAPPLPACPPPSQESMLMNLRKSLDVSNQHLEDKLGIHDEFHGWAEGQSEDGNSQKSENEQQEEKEELQDKDDIQQEGEESEEPQQRTPGEEEEQEQEPDGNTGAEDLCAQEEPVESSEEITAEEGHQKEIDPAALQQQALAAAAAEEKQTRKEKRKKRREEGTEDGGEWVPTVQVIAPDTTTTTGGEYGSTEVKRTKRRVSTRLRHSVELQPINTGDEQSLFMVCTPPQKFYLLTRFLRNKMTNNRVVVIVHTQVELLLYQNLFYVTGNSVISCGGNYLQPEHGGELPETMKFSDLCKLQDASITHGVLLVCDKGVPLNLQMDDIDWIVQLDPPKNMRHYRDRIQTDNRKHGELWLINENEVSLLLWLNQHTIRPLQALDFAVPQHKCHQFNTKMHQEIHKSAQLTAVANAAYEDYWETYQEHQELGLYNIYEMDLDLLKMSFLVSEPVPPRDVQPSVLSLCTSVGDAANEEILEEVIVEEVLVPTQKKKKKRVQQEDHQEQQQEDQQPIENAAAGTDEVEVELEETPATTDRKEEPEESNDECDGVAATALDKLQHEVQQHEEHIADEQHAKLSNISFNSQHSASSTGTGNVDNASFGSAAKLGGYLGPTRASLGRTPGAVSMLDILSGAQPLRKRGTSRSSDTKSLDEKKDIEQLEWKETSCKALFGGFKVGCK